MSQNYKQITLLWGKNFTNVLYLNTPVDGGMAFYSKSSGEVMGGPQMELVISESDNATPYRTKDAKLTPKAFSITVSINEGIGDPTSPEYGAKYGWLWHRRRHELMKALYSGLVRIVFDRYHPTVYSKMPVYLEAECEDSPEVDKGVFELKFTAADPVYTQMDAINNVEGGGMLVGNKNGPDPTWATTPGSPPDEDWMALWEEENFSTGAPASADVAAEYGQSYTPYIGSAPTEPIMTVEVTGPGNVWRYHKDVQITNPGPTAWVNQPVCLDLGDVSALRVAGKMQPGYIDVRLETMTGVRKQIYVRPYPDHSIGPNLKVWFVMHYLQPGETKQLRIFYGNPDVPGQDAEISAVKPMFTMYDSTNAQWRYNDFAPRYTEQQSRLAQWVPHIHGNQNITWLAYTHPDFGPASDPTLVAQAGAKATFHGRSSGYAGLELNTTLAISSIQYTRKHRLNYKSPFVQRSRHLDGRWDDDFVDPSSTGYRRFAAAEYAAGVTTITVQGATKLSDEGWLAGYTGSIGLTLTNTSTGETSLWDNSGALQISSFPTDYRMTLNAAIPAGYKLALGGAIWQWPHGRSIAERTQNFTAGDEPRTVMIGMRVDYPSLDIGEWFYGASEYVLVNFLAAQQPTIRWRATAPDGDFTSATFSGGFEFDLDDLANGYQLIGRFQNDNDGTGIRVNFKLKHMWDRLVLDCVKRECWYYEFDDSTGTFLEKVNAYPALYFEEVRDYWIRMMPEQEATAVKFVHDAQSNFRNLSIRVLWKNRYF